MAIDTRAKRQSVLAMLGPWHRLPDPDATKGQGWRQTVGGIYSGNNVGAPGGATEQLLSIGAADLSASMGPAKGGMAT